jgi:hypothetical protein
VKSYLDRIKDDAIELFDIVTERSKPIRSNEEIELNIKYHRSVIDRITDNVISINNKQEAILDEIDKLSLSEDSNELIIEKGNALADEYIKLLSSNDVNLLFLLKLHSGLNTLIICLDKTKEEIEQIMDSTTTVLSYADNIKTKEEAETVDVLLYTLIQIKWVLGIDDKKPNIDSATLTELRNKILN